jgi:hypothetical protein
MEFVMENFDRRLDEAFESALRRIPVRSLLWMEDEAAKLARKQAKWEGLPALSAREQAAEQTLRRWLIRDRIRDVWEARRRAFAEEARLVEEGRKGDLEVPDPLRGPVRVLAESIASRDSAALWSGVRSVCESFAPEYPWDHPEGSRTFRCDGVGPHQARRLVFMAGRVLCSAGHLEEAHAAFHWSRSAWHPRNAAGSSDDTLRVKPLRWRWGIPWRTQTVARPQTSDAIPRVSQVDWRPYDHVVGCGLTIRKRTLDLLGVPFDKQVIAEVHHWMPLPPRGSLPSLRGHVAIVDDVHEGQTAFTLARLYNADVIDVGDIGCTHLTARAHPVCQVEDDAVLADVNRRR